MFTRLICTRNALKFGAMIGLLAIGAASSAPAFAEEGSGGGGGGGPVFTVNLTGPAIGGVVPECECNVDESHALSGGSTIMTTSVKNVNLPDGTVLIVSVDFAPEGTITLQGGRGSAVSNLGRFAPGGRDILRPETSDTFTDVIFGLL